MEQEQVITHHGTCKVTYLSSKKHDLPCGLLCRQMGVATKRWSHDSVW